MSTADILAKYRQRLLEETQYVDLRGIPLPRDRSGRVRPLHIPLDNIYIHVQALEEKHARAERQAEETQVKRGLKGKPDERSGLRDTLLYLRELGEHLFRQAQVCKAAARPDPIDPQTALKEHRRLVILGAPGAGKTTLLKFLGRRAAQDPDGDLPFLIPCREYAVELKQPRPQGLRDFVLTRLGAEDEELRRELVADIDWGQTLWLVDALDEAPGWADKIALQIRDLPGKLLLTSRPLGYSGAGLEMLPHYEILPLTPQNINGFIQDWFAWLPAAIQAGEEQVAARVTGLKEQLAARPRLKPLTSNPLLLTFLVILAGQDPEEGLPESRAELYRSFVEELLVSWEQHRRPRAGFAGEPEFVLGPLQGEAAKQVALQGFFYLGWSLHLSYYGGRGKDIPTREAVICDLQAYLASLPEIKDKAAGLAPAVVQFWKEAGLLDVWNLGGYDYFACRHLTFQEYAAAWGLAEAWRKDPGRAWEFLRPRLHHYAWREPILLLAGIQKEKNFHDLCRRLLRGVSPYEWVLNRDLRLAAAVLAEGGQGEQKLRRQMVGRLAWLSRDHKITRLGTLLLCSGLLPGFFLWLNFGKFSLLGLLLAWYLSFAWPCLAVVQNLLTLPLRLWKNLPDRSVAVKLLPLLGPAALPHLERALADKYFKVRSAAAESLVQLGPEALPTLERILADKYNDVREAALRSLVQLDPATLPLLGQTLADRDFQVRTFAVMTMGQAGPAALPILKRALADKDVMMRLAAVQGLGQIGPSALPALEEALPRLKEDLPILEWDQADPWDPEDIECTYMRAEAVRSLGQLGPAALPLLERALADEYMGMVRAAAAESLGQIGPAALPTLERALDHKYPGVRTEAVRSLGHLGPVALPTLERALANKYSSVRAAAVESLAEMGAAAIPLVVKRMTDIYTDIRRAAVSAMTGLVDLVGDQKEIRKITRKLWWRLTDLFPASSWCALEGAANQKTRLEVEALPFTDPLLPATAPAWPSWLRYLAWLPATFAIVVLGLISQDIKNLGFDGFLQAIQNGDWKTIGKIFLLVLTPALEFLRRKIESPPKKT